MTKLKVNYDHNGDADLNLRNASRPAHKSGPRTEVIEGVTFELVPGAGSIWKCISHPEIGDWTSLDEFQTFLAGPKGQEFLAKQKERNEQSS